MNIKTLIFYSFLCLKICNLYSMEQSFQSSGEVRIDVNSGLGDLNICIQQIQSPAFYFGLERELQQLDTSIDSLNWLKNLVHEISLHPNNISIQNLPIIYLEKRILEFDCPEPKEVAFSSNEALFAYSGVRSNSSSVFVTETQECVSCLPQNMSIFSLKTVPFTQSTNFSFPDNYNLLFVCSHQPKLKIFSPQGSWLITYSHSTNDSQTGDLSLCQKIVSPLKILLILVLKGLRPDNNIHEKSLSVQKLMAQITELHKIWNELTFEERLSLGECFNFKAEQVSQKYSDFCNIC